MAESTETSSPSSSSPLPDLDNIYPVVIRIKRKSTKNYINPIAEFCDWLEDVEEDERPMKRTSLDFEKLSISDPAEKKGLAIGETGSPLKQSLVDFEKLSISEGTDAHFEQKWKRRERKKAPKKNVSIDDLCRRCDVLRVGVEEETAKEADEMSSADSELLYKFMPLLKECLPDVAENIQLEMQPFLFSKVLSL
ncbi:hypothetical protein MKW94_029563 [Papaver nudicaule]|uniref:Uncharacterized protein n=1 Tax=Papaver nudicaule TaxID=74823 RepID=A0AA42B322_PAPNU|nr:hypothetical protein [Papaver nudicaule]